MASTVLCSETLLLVVCAEQWKSLLDTVHSLDAPEDTLVKAQQYDECTASRLEAPRWQQVHKQN